MPPKRKYTGGRVKSSKPLTKPWDYQCTVKSWADVQALQSLPHIQMLSPLDPLSHTLLDASSKRTGCLPRELVPLVYEDPMTRCVHRKREDHPVDKYTLALLGQTPTEGEQTQKATGSVDAPAPAESSSTEAAASSALVERNENDGSRQVVEGDGSGAGVMVESNAKRGSRNSNRTPVELSYAHMMLQKRRMAEEEASAKLAKSLVEEIRNNMTSARSPRQPSSSSSPRPINHRTDEAKHSSDPNANASGGSGSTALVPHSSEPPSNALVEADQGKGSQLVELNDHTKSHSVPPTTTIPSSVPSFVLSQLRERLASKINTVPEGATPRSLVIVKPDWESDVNAINVTTPDGRIVRGERKSLPMPRVGSGLSLSSPLYTSPYFDPETQTFYGTKRYEAARAALAATNELSPSPSPASSGRSPSSLPSIRLPSSRIDPATTTQFPEPEHWRRRVRGLCVCGLPRDVGVNESASPTPQSARSDARHTPPTFRPLSPYRSRGYVIVGGEKVPVRRPGDIFARLSTRRASDTQASKTPAVTSSSVSVATKKSTTVRSSASSKKFAKPSSSAPAKQQQQARPAQSAKLTPSQQPVARSSTASVATTVVTASAESSEPANNTSIAVEPEQRTKSTAETKAAENDDSLDLDDDEDVEEDEDELEDDEEYEDEELDDSLSTKATEEAAASKPAEDLAKKAAEESAAKKAAEEAAAKKAAEEAAAKKAAEEAAAKKNDDLDLDDDIDLDTDLGTHSKPTINAESRTKSTSASISKAADLGVSLDDDLDLDEDLDSKPKPTPAPAPTVKTETSSTAQPTTMQPTLTLSSQPVIPDDLDDDLDLDTDLGSSKPVAKPIPPSTTTTTQATLSVTSSAIASKPANDDEDELDLDL